MSAIVLVNGGKISGAVECVQHPTAPHQFATDWSGPVMAIADSSKTIEMWMPVVGYEGFYEVSSKGRIRRLGKGRGSFHLRPISLRRRTKNGYVVVELCKNERKRRFLAHRLVARAFLGVPPTEDHCVNHLDAVKVNNVVENLEWVTRAENNYHANLLGLVPALKGEANGMSKLTADQVREIRSRPMSCRLMALHFRVSRTLIQRILNRKAWRCVQ